MTAGRMREDVSVIRFGRGAAGPVDRERARVRSSRISTIRSRNQSCIAFAPTNH